MRARFALLLLLVPIALIVPRSASAGDGPSFASGVVPTVEVAHASTSTTTSVPPVTRPARVAVTPSTSTSAPTTIVTPALPRNQLVFDGQSFNYSPWFGTKRTYPVQLLELLGSGVGVSAVAGIGSTSYADRAPSVATRVDSLYRRAQRTIVLDLAGQSDLIAGLLSGRILDAVGGYADARRAAGATYVVEFTIVPSTWFSVTQDVERIAYNTLLRANLGHHVDAVVDLASRPEFADPTNATYFIDGLHPTEAAAAIIAQMARDTIGPLLSR